MARFLTGPHALGRLASLVGVFALGLGLILPPVVAGAAPRTGDFFEYNYNAYVDQGSGGYYGYTDTMLSHARYSVMSVQGDMVTVHGLGYWAFDGSDGTHLSGITNVTPVLSLTTREYVSGADLNPTKANATEWFCIPVPVSVRQTVPVLDYVFTVRSIDATVWFWIIPHRA